MSEPCKDTYSRPQRHGEGPPITYICLRRVGHLDDHWAKGLGGRIVKRWVQQ